MKIHAFFIFFLLFLNSAKAIETHKGEYTWYEGRVAKKIYLRPNLAVTFAQNQEEKEDKYSGEVKLLQEFGGVKLFEVSKGFLDRLKTNESSKWSPVFSSSPESSYPMALAGGVIVQFKKGFKNENIKRWCKRHKLKQKMKLDDGKIVFDSAPGWESLILANRLRKESAIDSAGPVWWIPMVLK